MKKAAFYIFYVGLGGLLVLAWPFAFYVSIFAFDAPFGSAADEILRWAIVLTLWGYPVPYFFGLFWGIKVIKSGAPWASATRPSIILFLLPACVLGVTAFAIAANQRPKIPKVDDPTYRKCSINPWGTTTKGVYRAGILLHIE